MTDAIKIIGDLNIRYTDLISGSLHKDERSADEIKDLIKGKIRRLRKQGD